MKIYKEIAFAYPTSNNAKELGFYNDGCFYIEHTYHNIENSGQSKSLIAHNCEGFADRNNPDLIALLHEYEGSINPIAKNIASKDKTQSWRIGQ